VRHCIASEFGMLPSVQTENRGGSYIDCSLHLKLVKEQHAIYEAGIK
tara:strand:+ start:19032 stop:19172 length:141 start_codon:yes stop_codon:yes gene_type:complete